MFPDYQAEVLAAYQKKREAGQLSLHLMHPSPAKLRTECLLVLRDRYLKKDDRVIRNFFELPLGETDYAQVIRKFDVDKFRPLVNFINRRTEGPVEKQVELLAWLIDFEPRPYQFGPPLSTLIEEELLQKKAATQTEPTGITPEIKAPEKKTSSKRKVNPILLLCAVVLFAGAIGYGAWDWFNYRSACAVWTGTRYEGVPCDQQKDNNSVVVVDHDRLSDFRLITRPDTLSEHAIGRVWYFKRNDSLELYTRSGYHPLHPERVVKKLTEGMYKKYVPKRVYNTSL